MYRTTYAIVRKLALEQGKKIMRVLDDAVKNYVDGQKTA